MNSKDSLRFSPVGFAVAVLTVGTGTAVGLAFVPTVGAYVGMLAGGFVAGLVLEARPTVESGVAAALASVGVLVAGALPGAGVVDAVMSLTAVDPVTFLVSLALAFAVGAFGGHFGDDLRDGLTEPLPETAPGTSSERVDGQSATTDGDAVTSREGQRATADAIDGARDRGDPERADSGDELDAGDGHDAGADEESVDRDRTEFELEEN